jgi:hypothetical protein
MAESQGSEKELAVAGTTSCALIPPFFADIFGIF